MDTEKIEENIYHNQKIEVYKYMNVCRKKFINLILGATAIIIGYITFQCLFISPNTTVFQGNESRYVLLMVFLSLCLGTVVLILYNAIQKKYNEKIVKGVLILCVLIGQVIIFYYVLTRNMMPSTDLATNVEEAFYLLENGHFAEKSSAAIYPFNRTHIILYYFYYRLLRRFNITCYWMCSLIMSIVCMDIAILFTCKSARILLGEKGSNLVLLFCVLNPITYLCVPYFYTSITSLPFMMISLYLVLRLKYEDSRKKSVVYGILLGVFTVIGYKIRGNGSFPFIALMVFTLLTVTFKGDWKKKVVCLGIKMLSVIISILVISTLWSSVIQHYDPYDRSESVLPISFSVMMSMQEQGGFNKDDFNKIMQYETVDEKNQVCKEVIEDRLDKLGISGLFQLIGEKIKFNWAEGHSRFTNWYDASFKYISGYKRDFLMLYSQVLRIVVFGLMLIGVLSKLIKRQYDATIIPIIIMFGAFLSHIPIECNPQYNIPFLLTMFLISADGANCVYRKYCCSMQNNKYFIIKFLKYCSLIGLAVTVIFSIEYNKPFTQYKRNITENISDQGYRNTYFVLNNMQSEISQTFVTDEKFNGIKIKVNILNQEICDELYRFQLKNDSEEIIYDGKFSINQVDSSGQWLNFSFKNIVPLKKEKYTFIIVKIKEDTPDVIAFAYENRKLDYYTEGNMYVNGINNNECDMTFIVENRCEKTIYSRKQYAAFWGSVVLLEMFVVVFLIIKDRRICNSMKGKEYDSV